MAFASTQAERAIEIHIKESSIFFACTEYNSKDYDNRGWWDAPGQLAP